MLLTTISPLAHKENKNVLIFQINSNHEHSTLNKYSIGNHVTSSAI